MTVLSTRRAAAVQSAHLTGVLYGAGAGAVWGLVFLAPVLAREFTPLQLCAGRYLCYGLIAAVLLAPRWRALAPLIGRPQWFQLLGLAFSGNILYYVLLATAVQTGGIAMTSLVIGFLPVVVTVVGSREHGAVPLRRLLPSVILCMAGAVCIGWQALVANSAGPLAEHALGLLCAIGALALWSAYAVANARCLQQLNHVSTQEWTMLTGIVTGALSVLLVPFAVALDPMQHSSPALLRFTGVSAGVAVLASCVGNALWNRMSRLLPLTLVGQMILFETAFSLLYAFLWERRLPTAMELAALGLVTSSVLSCLAVHQRPAMIESA